MIIEEDEGTDKEELLSWGPPTLVMTPVDE